MMQIQKLKQGYKYVKWYYGKQLEIPKEWTVLYLEDICKQIQDADHVVPKKTVIGVPFLTINNIVENDQIDFSSATYVSEEDYLKFIKKIKPEQNDILYSRVATIGIARRIEETKKFVVTSNVVVLKIKDMMNSKFLTQLLNCALIKNRVLSLTPGSAYAFLSLKEIKKIPVLSPPMSEQLKIASILSNIDSIIHTTQKKVEQIQKLKSGLMQKLFSKGIGHTKFKITEIGELPETWKIFQMEKILSITQYGLSDKLSTQGNYPIFRMNCIEKGFVIDKDMKFIDLTDKTFQDYKLEKGDLLFNRTNSLYLVGKVGIFLLEGNYAFASYLIRLRTNEKMNPLFLNLYLNSSKTQARIKSLATQAVSQTNINATNLKKLLVPIPSLSEQLKIASILSNIDSQIQKQQKYKSNLENLKKGLMQKLLTGQIRVKV